MSVAPVSLRVDRIQASIYPGFDKDEHAFLWLRFPGSESARAWLAETVPELTSAAHALADGRGMWTNVAFAKAGLDLLTQSPPASFPEAFEQGMARRAEVLRDTPLKWRFGGTPETEAHALLILGDDDAPQLLRAIAVHRERLARHGARDLFLDLLGTDCRGAKLPDTLRGHEHFGYRDGIGQPRLDGSSGTGDFVLGYPDSAGAMAASGPAWTRDGSYAVFRRLRQDVAGFHRGLEAAAQAAGLKNRAQLGAKLFGRWPSGAKLGDPIEAVDPGTKEPEEYGVDELASDPKGERVPLFAHVRKAHPHSSNVPGGLRHRLLRRGIPYGPPLLATGTDGMPREDDVDRGLLFFAYQVDLAGQYERVQRWLNDPNIPVTGAGQDAIAGQSPGAARLVLRSSNTLPGTFDMQNYVSMTGGGYFFTPSLSAVRFLADPTTTWEQQEVIMGDVNHEKLGQLIFSETPYGAMTTADLNQITRTGIGKARNSGNPFPDGTRVRTPAEPEYWQGFFWTIGAQDGQTETVRVSKALRIRYTVGGHEYRLIVGYEGAGGP